VTLQCPNCHSKSITTKNLAKKAYAISGFIEGVLGELIISNRMIGVSAGAPSGLTRVVIGTVINGIASGTIRCITAANLGEAIDIHGLDIYLCQNCRFAFNRKHYE
jgi:hypothetical protein